MPRLGFKLSQDGIAKSFSSDASSVGDKKYGAIGHWGGLRKRYVEA
jgi:hypothetical protein